ncbi:helix-turn-helix transcriptional regulator [Bradyrhizobium sp. U87765 SZCCT0131]|uniref:helix-turn-helix transcriptional regulator n=1 Tax=unclassified Bradyrhizobium TaxID=2631580 RepID=UPI001BA82B1F|nr:MULTISPECIES: AraC family transcriptional regulator [unclassified Bradyrhizobium]MBR1218044.1 helix-turn-helix transcriptional regulator [Bradyrhizobium sp. U87765 SZCCT0131]MBR1261010.1 helix-turn-helix transcriptional regulator [Bradyrhizobium sp. U87765 SZCCT0134]MBR1303542.1 helix-turn-helix transcriptional regulator [Bradyrhizobium sp. U87765 SZCCT0110]MBR1319148.1 helix-turn-helix transcriptional regulator [Bradyrhizobium sp. U87765 SZCCT0109]MBR1347473.1 helix-turn-helix transcriptio
MQQPESIEEMLARRFHVERPTTLIAKTVSSAPIMFSRLRSTQAMHGRSMSVPPEDAFTFQVPLKLPFFSGLWTAGKRLAHNPASPGDAFLFDLNNNPTVGLNNPFDSLRFFIPRKSLDELAFDQGLRAVGGLRSAEFGSRDMVLYGLAQAIVATMERPGEGNSLFADYAALAFHSHIVRAYGSISALQQSPRGLAAWQMRRIADFIDANLSDDISIDQLSKECGLSARYFARAFKQSTGMPPHQWLMKRRVDKAKELLQMVDWELTDIASTCGFVDQSHFTRVFSRVEGNSPGRWRRERWR